MFSADHYFMRGGQYMFDPTQLPAAHGDCLRKFINWAQRPNKELAIVDNTNTSIAEVAPYAATALAYGHTIEIITFLCPPDIAAKRNVHGVPQVAVESMDRRLRASISELPPWWSHQTINCQ
jgi:predicted kinase